VFSTTSKVVSLAVGVNCTVHRGTQKERVGAIKLSVCRIKLRDCRSLAGGFDRVLSVAGVAVLGCAVLNISSSIPFLD
jgi:hypothetical protein